MESGLQYVTDDTGKKTAVLLPIREYEALMEDLKDLAAIANRRDEDTVPHDEFIAELRKDGILSD
jgi:PHD/YefM family antitoxin component YafN of YafNO toxin-antitoxin module